MKHTSRRAALRQGRVPRVTRPHPQSQPAVSSPKPQPAAIPGAATRVLEHAFDTWQIGSAAPEVRSATRLWHWCEWLRISLVTAALFAAGLVMAAQTVAQRARARSARLQYMAARPAPQPQVQPRYGNHAIGPIHYWSDENSTTLSIDLQDLVFFEGHQLRNPDRVYFDLKGIQMPRGLHGKVVQVGVAEAFVRKIRVAEWRPGITRVVLETPRSCAYSAMIAPDPYRLIVKLHAPD
jgi:hypothetical protein